jgi:Transglycosylase SLT domain
MPPRTRIVLAGSAVCLVIAIVVAAGRGGPSPIRLPSGRLTWSATPLGYESGHDPQYVARAVSGSALVLFQKSPGGVIATAAQVAHWRPDINAAAAGSGIDPDLLEGLVFLESAGNPNALAGADAADAAGLTQILAQTGSSLLGMRINLAQSRKLTTEIDAAFSAGNQALMARLQRQRARVDARFNPPLALAATVRYLKLAERDLGGREDLAFVSYHSGIGNLQRVLGLYDGGHAVPYAQLYFDIFPNHNGAAYDLLSSLGDDSSLYWWRVLGAVQIMHLYRTDRSALQHLVTTELAPIRMTGGAISPVARDLLAELQDTVGELRPGHVQLPVASEGGLTFSIRRHYASYAQAVAFQAVLDRLQALDLINWKRTSSRILIVVEPDAARYLVNGP